MAKTDKLDARCIVEFAHAMNLKATIVPNQNLDTLNEYLTHQEFLIREMAKYKTTLHACNTQTIKDSIIRMIEAHEQEIKNLEKMMLQLVKADEELYARYDIYLSIKGIGPRGAISLVALMPELGSMNKHEAASLIGVAPFDRQSGEMRGTKRIYGGRRRVRRIMYLCSIPAIRFYDVMRERYISLVSRGKGKKLALIACARKLTIHANSLIKNDQAALKGEK